MSEYMNGTSHIEMDESTLNNAKVKVFGVGGAGGNTVNRMVGMNIEGVEYYAVNTDAKALELATALAETSVKQVREKDVANAMFHAAEISARRGDYRMAQRYYEKARDSHYKGRKQLFYRLSAAARRNGDITAAIQALTDAIGCCDKVEGKKEIASLKRQIANLSQTIRDKVREQSAEDVFGNTSDEIGGLDLDEF